MLGAIWERVSCQSLPQSTGDLRAQCSWGALAEACTAQVEWSELTVHTQHSQSRGVHISPCPVPRRTTGPNHLGVETVCCTFPRKVQEVRYQKAGPCWNSQGDKGQAALLRPVAASSCLYRVMLTHCRGFCGKLQHLEMMSHTCGYGQASASNNEAIGSYYGIGLAGGLSPRVNRKLGKWIRMTKVNPLCRANIKQYKTVGEPTFTKVPTNLKLPSFLVLN